MSTEALFHYIIVRRDLPLGLVLAMVAHAAGESFYEVWRSPLALGAETSGPEPETFHPHETIAVVLGARNEHRLHNLASALQAAAVRFVSVNETTGEYAGQLMAIGLVPAPKETAVALLRDFHMLRELSPPGP